ncbi:MAG: HD-GYP domain-containing protein, partial [Bacillota bacterium]
DVNGLKLVNDAFGHDLGDRLLVQIARLLDNCCRQEDVVARWGGDEFVILLPRTGRQAARRIINRINRACKKAGDDPIQPSISLGFITKEEESSDIWDKLKTAEKWMYKHKLLESESARSSIISSLEETLWEKDYETKEHAQRIKNMALKMGQALGLPENKLDELILLAGLHDIGKIAISDSILLKPDSFTEKEWEAMKKHPEIGYRIAQASSELVPVAEGILHHHEWWDGSGYPYGLSGEDIPLTSRIICIVDAFDVMVHERPYKQPIGVEEALVELKRCAGQQFDPELVRVFEKEVYPHLYQLENIDLDRENTNLQIEEERR